MSDSMEIIKNQFQTVDEDLLIKKQTIEELNKELKKQKELYTELQKKLIQAEEENNKLISRTNTFYTPEDLSVYFNRTIEAFNSNEQSDTEQAKYIISTMDVDLKAHIYADEKGSIKCIPPALTNTSEESLSSIKISIRAIPKE